MGTGRALRHSRVNPNRLLYFLSTELFTINQGRRELALRTLGASDYIKVALCQPLLCPGDCFGSERLTCNSVFDLSRHTAFA